VNEHPPELVMELALRGEPLGEGDWARHLATCPDCARRLDEMRAEDAHYRATAQARALRARLGAAPPAAPPRRVRPWLPVIVPALALAAVALFWVRSTEREDPYTEKGGGLELTVQRGGRSAAWDGSPVRAGDLLQLGWSSGSKGYLAVMAREADGTVTTLFPESGDQATAIGAGAHQPLGRSLIADGRPLEILAFYDHGAFALPALRAAMDRREPLAFSGKRQVMKVPGTPP
jgi:hypothetical protein